MSATLADSRKTRRELQLVTFRCADLLLGLDIGRIQEINRHTDIASVPEAPQYVCGAINLRGDLATIIDLRTVLGMPRCDVTRRSRNVMVKHNGEMVGLLVDGVSDIVATSHDRIERPPANLNGIDGRFFLGVYDMPTEIVVVLDLDEVLTFEY
ncbi:MAG: chemotaxis protein CheW [Planctomycetales bacterium]|nr:chemotaxis protein CheW [Planctomycetales bacterium]